MGHLPTETFTDRPITNRAALYLVNDPILAAWEGLLPTRTFTDQGTHGLPADYAFPKVKPARTLNWSVNVSVGKCPRSVNVPVGECAVGE